MLQSCFIWTPHRCLQIPNSFACWGEQDRRWSQPSLLYNGYRVWVFFPWVKRPGCGLDYPPPSSAEVKERVELYFYSPFGPSWPVLGWILPFYSHWTQLASCFPLLIFMTAGADSLPEKLLQFSFQTPGDWKVWILEDSILHNYFLQSAV
jgi:hypothetical protein